MKQLVREWLFWTYEATGEVQFKRGQASQRACAPALAHGALEKSGGMV
jgi:hypothetical protein